MTDIEMFLCEYRGVKNRIRELEIELSETEAKKQAQYDKMLQVKQLKPERIHGGPEHDPVVEAVSKLVDVYAEREKKIAEDLKAANGKLAFIEDTVKKAGLNEVEHRCVCLRFFKGLKMWEVAQELKYSEKQSYNYKQAALDKIKSAFG